MPEISEIVEILENHFSIDIPPPDLYPKSFNHYLMMYLNNQKNKGNKYIEGG